MPIPIASVSAWERACSSGTGRAGSLYGPDFWSKSATRTNAACRLFLVIGVIDPSVPRAVQGRPRAIIAGSLQAAARLSAAAVGGSPKAGHSEIPEPKPYRARNRKFESISLQRGV